MNRQFLRVQEQELRFSYELGREATCSFWLSNMTKERIAFEVTTSNPYNYRTRPWRGVLLPQETCQVMAIMRAPEVPIGMQPRDNFVILSRIAGRWATSSTINSNMFGGVYVERHQLRVVHFTPLQVDAEEQFTAYVREELLREGGYVRSISTWVAYGFLALAFFILIQMTLSLIWSFIIVLMMKTAMKITSDALEDWIIKIIVYIFFHVIFKFWDYILGSV